MFEKIIIGYDGTDTAEDALAFGQALRQGTATELVVVGVFPDWPYFDPEQQDQFARKVEAAAHLIGAQADAFPSNSPARGLHEAAEELGADLVVVGSASETTVGHMSAGNVAVSLLHGSPCAVVVAPVGLRSAEVALNEIAVALDGSDESREAQHTAVALAQASGAKLRLVTVIVAAQASAFGWGYGVFDIETELRAAYQRTLDEAASQVPDGIDVKTELLSPGSVSELIDQAARGVDLLCLGSRGYGPIRRVLLGSTSAQIVKHAPCAVLVVPRGVHGTAAAEPTPTAAERGS